MGGFAHKPPDSPHAAPAPEHGQHSYDFHSDYLNQGAACDGKQGQGDCFLSDPGRARVIGDFQRLCDHACTNYKLALAELKTEILMQPQAEMSWFVSMALDLVGAHLVSAITKGLVAARAAGSARLQAMNLLAGARGEFSATSWTSRADTALHQLSPATITGLTQSGWAPIKVVAGKGLQGHMNEESLGEKSGNIAYLDSLRDSCDAAFLGFGLGVAGQASDAEIVALWQGMQPELHTVGVYKMGLQQKLKDFKVSGVNEIGKRHEVGGSGGKDIATKVVLVRDIHGATRPWYQRSEQTTVATPAVGLDKTGYGAAQLDKPVPADFAEIAIQRQIATWGAIETIDDGYVAQLKQSGQDVEDVRRRLEHKPTPQEQAARHAFEHYADPPLVAPKQPPAPLPDGSVFDPMFVFRSKP